MILVSLRGIGVCSSAAARAMADEVAGPVLCAYIIDSDVAHVRLVAPGQELFDFVLNEEGAAIYEIRVDPRVHAQVPQRVQARAGPQANPRAVAEAVAGNLMFAEDVVLRLGRWRPR